MYLYVWLVGFTRSKELWPLGTTRRRCPYCKLYHLFIILWFFRTLVMNNLLLQIWCDCKSFSNDCWNLVIGLGLRFSFSRNDICNVFSVVQSYCVTYPVVPPRAKKKNVITSLVFCSFTRSLFVFATVHHSLWQLSLEPFLQPFLDSLPCYTDCNSSQTVDVRLNKCCLVCWTDES